jgi:cysteine-S-conjugate beta-lyase
LLTCAPEQGRVAQEVPLVDSGAGYVVDIDCLAREINARTKVLILCNPHNPTGRVFTRQELEGIGELAVRHNLVILSDEIHQDLLYQGQQHIPIASLSSEVEARTITFTSASKAFNIAGIGCAVAMFGSAALHQQFNAFPKRCRGRVSTVSLAALRAAWQLPDSEIWLNGVRQQLRENRQEVLRFFAANIPAVVIRPPEATFLAWCDCRELNLGPTPGKFFLETARVALVCGSHFGQEGKGFARINFATSREILDELLRRIAAAVAAV